MKVSGVDLAGREENPTGVAIFDEKLVKISTVYSDVEIIKACLGSKVVAIDAPLSMPTRGSLRECDLALISRGLRVLPPKLKGMLQLTRRGMALAEKLRMAKLKVVEVHPRSSGILLFNTDERKKWVELMKMKGIVDRKIRSEHEIDAVMAALTAWLHLRKKTEMLGGKDGAIIIPLPDSL